jgi:hypothetical protein
MFGRVPYVRAEPPRKLRELGGRILARTSIAFGTDRLEAKSRVDAIALASGEIEL